MKTKSFCFKTNYLSKALLFWVLFLCSQYINATNWYINDSSQSGDVYTSLPGNDSAPGNGTASNPYATLLKAYNAASSGDIIYVDTGTYTDVKATTFNITKSIQIIGVSFIDTVFKLTSGTDRWSTINANNVVLKKFQITNYNYDTADGIALSITGGTGIILDQVGIYGSVGSGGQGALYITGNSTSVTIKNTSMPCNRVSSALYGGALKINGSTVAIQNCSYSNNILSAIQGGAILIGGSTANVTIDKSLFENNEAASGGAICITNGTVNINNCCFNANKSVSSSDNLGGGAILIQAANNGTTTNVNFNNCTFTSNQASASSQDGGAVKITNLNSPTCNIVFNTCSFTTNSSSSNGCDVSFTKSNSPNFSVIFKNTTFNTLYSTGSKVNLNNTNFSASWIDFQGLTSPTSAGGNGDIVADGSGVAISKPEMTGVYTESTTNLPTSLPSTTCIDRYNGVCGAATQTFVCETKNIWGDISTTAVSNANVYTMDKGANVAKNITSATNVSNIVFTSAAHGYSVGDWVTVEGCSPSTYNGYYKITAVATNTFTVSKGITPGTFTSGGTVTKGTPIGWSRNSTPTVDENVIIDYNYNTTTFGNIDACKLTVNSGKTLTIDNDDINTAGVDTNGTYTYVVNSIINNGTINVYSQANLVQVNSPKDINDEAIVTPTINVTKTTGNKIRWDYIYWSKPISNTFLTSNFSTFFDLKYYWDPDYCNAGVDYSYLGWQTLTSEPSIGTGFIARVKTSIGTNPTSYSHFINGTSNNGDYIANVKYYGGNDLAFRNFTLLGNPYPGALDFFAFYNDNSDKIYGTAYLWTSYTVYTGTGEYQQADYASFNLTGGVGVSGATTQSPSSLVPNGYIPSAQGFMVRPKVNGTVTFKNAHRTKFIPSNNQFFRESTSEKNKYWIKINDENHNSNEILIGYLPEATNDFDEAFDGLTVSNSDLKLYSILDENKLCIQGKSNFDENDIVPIGLSKVSTNEEILTLRLSKTEGIFSNGQNIILHDKKLDLYHNLKESPYSFTAAHNLDNRFELVYRYDLLNNSNFGNNSFFNYYFINNHLNIGSSEIIKKIMIYDISGKLIFDIPENNNQFSREIPLIHGVYIVKVKLFNENEKVFKILK